eukprot:TRINITY_DN646_c0_g1_i1.p1 TRINITY_DN646_c0_g1~~TRINITY_DN646_c0_g1_i1.p1  ORF type:complete len:536 (+),score=172.38 TRINITY_DN646_c0_g1_i1:33-1640(+)
MTSDLTTLDSSAITKEDLVKENAELEKQIKALKDKLGITKEEEKQEKARAMELFKLADRDGNGHVDYEEFEILAYQCGVPLHLLTDSSKKKILAEINPKGDGKITFEDFFKWVAVAEKEDSKTDTKEAKQLKMMKMKLQSRSWVKGLQNVKAMVKDKLTKKEEKKDDKAKETTKVIAKKEEKTSKEEKPKASVKDEKEEKEKTTTTKKEKTKGSSFDFRVGDFKDAKAGIYLTGGADAPLATETREAVDAPSDCKCFLFVDFALKDNAADDEVGTLIGMLETLLEMVPWDMLAQYHHSHTLKVVTLANSKKVLRFTIFSEYDPDSALKQMTGQDISLADYGNGELKLEVPVDVTDLMRSDFRFTPDKFKVHIAAQSHIDQKLMNEAQSALESMSPEAKFIASMRLKLSQFFKGMNISVHFQNIDDFLAQFPQLPKAEESRYRYRRSSMAKFRDSIEELQQQPIAEGLNELLMSFGAMAAQFGQAQLYNGVRSCLSGLSVLHFQVKDTVTRLTVKGLDVFGLLPELPQELLSQMGI